MSERIHKFLANQGLGSRREIERWIEAGDIEVNGKVCKLGQQVNGDEDIVVRGAPVRVARTNDARVLIYHKPAGEIVTRSDPENRPTVFNKLPYMKTGRWIAIGRLDINTSGLLLLTTDGELANNLMHPRYEVEREYKVRILGEVTDNMLSRLQQGVRLEDGMAKFVILEAQQGKGANSWFRVVLKQGRNREVRRLWESQGVQVSRLIRTRYGSITLPVDLHAGRFLELSSTKMKRLYAEVANE